MYRWTALCLAALWTSACSLPSSSPEESGLDPVAGNRLWWIQPQTGDVLSGSVLLEAGVEIDEPVESVTFLVDGSTWETVREPPWISEWSDAEMGFHELEFIVAGSRSHYEGKPIEIELEAKLRMFISAPKPGRWQTYGSGDSLSVQACPGSTAEPDDDLLWKAGATSWLGPSFPLALLAPGRHRISAEGSFSGRTLTVVRDLEIVQVSRASSPEDTWSDLLGALRTRNTQMFEARLADGMIFIPCTDGFTIFAGGAHLKRTEFVGRLKRLWQEQAGRALGWRGIVERIERWPAADPTTAWLQIESFELFADTSPDCDGTLRAGEFPTRRIRTRVLVRKLDDGWRVVQWSEHGGRLPG